MRPIRVFVLEDEFYTLDALRIFLSQDPRTVYSGGAQDPEIGLKEIATCRADEKPDVILVDMRFRDRSGIREIVQGQRIIERIQRMSDERTWKPKILCMSMSLDPHVAQEAIAGGANGFLDKNQAAEGIVDAVVLAYTGHLVLSPSIADALLNTMRELDGKEVLLFPDKPPPRLSKRTHEVAYLYLRCGMSARDISEKLFIEESTVRSHIKRAMSLITTSSHSKAIQRLNERFDQDQRTPSEYSDD